MSYNGIVGRYARWAFLRLIAIAVGLSEKYGDFFAFLEVIRPACLKGAAADTAADVCFEAQASWRGTFREPA